MTKKHYNSIMRNSVAAMLCCCVALCASAYSPSKYATTSKLSTGKWVKIAIPENGVYEITEQELKDMGFSNINQVHIYGNGGHMMYEGINGKAIDDLQQIPSTVLNGKLCFYGKGPVKMTYASERFTRVINAYSTMGYYFLHDGGSDLPLQSVASQAFDSNAISYTTSHDYFYHEKELFSFGSSGKDLMGEDITSGTSIDFNLPQVASNSITLLIGAASKVLSGSVVLSPTITTAGGTATATLSNAIVKSVSSNYYNACTASGTYTTSDMPTTGKLNVAFSTTGATVSVSKLDYFIFTYTRHNAIGDAADSQMRMAFPVLNEYDCIKLSGATSTTQLWNINDETSVPINCELIATDSCMQFSLPIAGDNSQWVAFDPQGTLKKIAKYEVVNNQNIHGMATPNMVIITNKVFMDQAQRIADLHKMVDGMDVAIIDQEEIFNEFSSGTPDAMAYRLMCKMFYDRDKSKFKYLLLFGEGSYDNRGLSSVKPNRILTYESDNSTSETNSYTSDDFFACLEDNASKTPTACKLSIAVGRFPSANPTEAKSDVDKLIKYVLSPDYGPWRNNALLSAEYKTETYADMHQAQAEGIAKIMENTLNTGFAIDKAYVSMFPKAVNETAIVNMDDRSSYEGNRHYTEALKRGQYFASYIGHAGYKNFTGSRLWTTPHVTSVTYPHLPIFTTACCDVARFDSDQRGIAEHMFHVPNGGAIALLTATREVFADSNHNLNKSWTTQMFTWDRPDGLPRLGDVYLAAKKSLTSSALNHFKYVLFGDPAMKLAYPVPLFKITQVNGVNNDGTTQAITQPLGEVKVTAQVTKKDGSLDTDFTGDATLTIYDSKRFFKSATDVQIKADATDIYYPEEILTQVKGRVVNGIFNGTAIMPRYCRAAGEKGSIRIFAHQDGTDKMVNGLYTNLLINKFTTEGAVTDGNAPVIESMYLNEEQSFNDGAVVPANSTLYIKASDDVAINNQTVSMGNNMRLTLDGGKASFYLVNNFATVSNGGKDMEIAFPLSDMGEGQHTLSYTVHDMAGNAATRSISFIVGNVDKLSLNVEELPATTAATINIASTTLATTPQVNLKVTDVLGNLVYSTTTSTFPATWDLKDMTGKRVKGGVYKIFGNYESGHIYGGTNVTQVIVVDPLK